MRARLKVGRNGGSGVAFYGAAAKFLQAELDRYDVLFCIFL